MRTSILLAGIAAIALSGAPLMAQTTPGVTSPSAPATVNPKNNNDTQSCTQPAPGEAHLPANCAQSTSATQTPEPNAITPPANSTNTSATQSTTNTQSATPASTQTNEPSRNNRAQPASMEKTQPAIPAAEPTPKANPAACGGKPGTVPSTPSPPGCDTNSGTNEGGPFGH